MISNLIYKYNWSITVFHQSEISLFYIIIIIIIIIVIIQYPAKRFFLISKNNSMKRKSCFVNSHCCMCASYCFLKCRFWKLEFSVKSFMIVKDVCSHYILSSAMLYVYVMIRTPVMWSQYSPLCCWWLIWPIQNDKKTLKNVWNPSKWVLIWECSARAIQWIPTWQGWHGFQKF